ncbi:MAG: cytochrome c [Gammaproteobacteria bacterium]|nr:cytochrome c [Gammaproteobacteria bacterium]MDE0280424.1 cytochrome c [Gammaproteobacteria bacterium]MDE0716210.1 cytochrome c [Gammaproteobacteria bacterium]MXX17672.1 cytochrome c [Gammaproteobacteria bacterium]MXY64410.1 cytochrome c [Gammaproteobacteria bacterium]
MNILARTGLVPALLAFLVQPALSEGDADAGRLKAETCLGCHASPTMQHIYPTYRIPKVGGQHAAYVVSALKAYRDGTRPHSTMHANAWSLSDQDIEDIAAFFAASK